MFGAVLSGALKWSAADLYDAQAKLKDLTAVAQLELQKVSCKTPHVCRATGAASPMSFECTEALATC